MYPRASAPAIVCDGLQQPRTRGAVQHAQDRGVGLGGEELEDGQHAPRADVVTVQKPQRIGCMSTQSSPVSTGTHAG